MTALEKVKTACTAKILFILVLVPGQTSEREGLLEGGVVNTPHSTEGFSWGIFYRS